MKAYNYVLHVMMHRHHRAVTVGYMNGRTRPSLPTSYHLSQSINQINQSINQSKE